MFSVVSKKLALSLSVIFLVLCGFLTSARTLAADELQAAASAPVTDSRMQQLKEMDLFLQWMEASRDYQGDGAAVDSVPDGCLSSPLPTSPKKPNYTVSHTYNKETMSMTFWRETCKSGTGVALLMRATPKVGSPLLCGTAFDVIQDGIQHTNIYLQSAPGSLAWCGELLVPTTLIVNEYEWGQEQFDPAKALTIVYGLTDADRVTLEIPESTDPTPHLNGTTDGYKSYSATCKNITSGKEVKIPLRAGSKPWDCGAAGLAIKSGDKIKVTITGSTQ